jgi:hypothetical protein
MADERILIDSGATANFIDKKVAKRLGFKPKKLDHPVPVKNVDGTPNKDGKLTHCVHLWVELGDKRELMKFFLTNLGEDRTLLSFPWFTAFNPEINWTKGTMDNTPLRVYSQAAASQKPRPITKKGGARQRNTWDKELIFGIRIRPEVINKTMILTDLAAKKAEGQEKKDWSELVPSAYHHHAKVFGKKAAE